MGDDKSQELTPRQIEQRWKELVRKALRRPRPKGGWPSGPRQRKPKTKTEK